MPKWPLRFFRWFCRTDYVEDIEGDLRERFNRMGNERGFANARTALLIDIIKLIRPGVIRPVGFKNSRPMFQHHIKISYRALWRNKSYSIINIGGLAIGMTVAMLIGLWIYDELSFDRVHTNYDRISQVMQNETINQELYTSEAVPFPLGDELRQNYGDQFEYLVMSSWAWTNILSFDKNQISRTGRYMEPDAPVMLSLEMLAGTRNGLEEINSILLSQSTSLALFGEENSLGKLVKINGNLSAIVRGVYRDLPFNSRFKELAFIAPWRLYISSEVWLQKVQEKPSWNDNSFNLFAQIASNTSFEEANNQIRLVKYNHLPEEKKKLRNEIMLHPMKDWHLRSSWENGFQQGGLILYVWLFGIIGVFVMVLACINFMNLSTAQAVNRSKEVGVRKSLGSLKGQLINQFFTESYLVTLAAFALACAISYLLLPYFNELAGKQVKFPLYNPWFWGLGVAFLLVTGLLAGSYPAFYLSTFRPINMLKSTQGIGKSSIWFRRALVTVQFTVSISLIAGTLLVHKQINFTKNRPIGYDQNGTVMIEMTTPEFYGKFDLVRNELKAAQAVTEIGQSSSPLTEVYNTLDGMSWQGKDPDFKPYFNTIWVSPEFGKTIGWEIVEGRDFSREFTSDANAYIINEAAANYINLEEPVGKKLRWYGDDGHEIIGVVRDLLIESPYQEVSPTIYIMDDKESMANFFTLRLNPNLSPSEAMLTVQGIFEKHFPNIPFDYQFTDLEFARKFTSEERIGTLSGIFAALAILISCIGLLGMVSFTAAQRTKEIGIRKVLGATIVDIWKLLSNDFVILVSVACLLAIPLAYIFLSHWLERYDYRTELSWWVFAMSGVGALALTLVTVSFKAISAASLNPVESLKSE